ncbi:MAG: hypothetical protein KatS3mg110_2381 [Pirellulaceae bacterium]|nr:MAG: hypothetical protein KatS3mg110_2381 [Pirellulaceae bacterium]
MARVPPRHDNRHLSTFLEFIRKVIVCGLYPPSFRAESSSEDPVLKRDGSNFAAWYRHLLLERHDLVPGFTNALQEVIKGLRAIRMEKVGLDTRALMVIFEQHAEEEQHSPKYELRFDELSDGERALIALYTLLLLAGGQGYTLLLDEPDNYLALAEIQPWLIKLADACGNTIAQAFICSHHPELIDYLGPERGLLLEREASGVTRVRLVTEAFDLDAGLKLSESLARGWRK